MAPPVAPRVTRRAVLGGTVSGLALYPTVGFADDATNLRRPAAIDRRRPHRVSRCASTARRMI